MSNGTLLKVSDINFSQLYYLPRNHRYWYQEENQKHSLRF